MATYTRPFVMTGAALASAAAIVAATPQLMPSVTASPLKLSQAQFEMTSFADLLALTPADYSDAFFLGYGGVVGNLEYVTDADGNPVPVTPPTTPPSYYPLFNDPYAGADWNIWWKGCAVAAGQAGQCAVAGLSGVAYMALDALINGSLVNEPPGGNRVGALNYFFEAGFSAGSEYLAQSSLAAQNPVLATLIQLAFLGPQLVTTVYTQALTTAALLVNAVPLVGPYVAGGIYAYLGNGGYTPGLTGLLNYVIDLVTNNPNTPFPPIVVSGASALAPAAATAVGPLTRVSKASAAEAPAVDLATTAGAVTSNADSANATEIKPESTKADETKADATTTEVKAETGTDTVKTDTAETTAADKTADTPAPSVDTPAAGQTDTATDAPAPKADNAPKARKRPVRDAVEKVTSGISNALKGATAGAGAAGSAAESGSAANAG